MRKKGICSTEFARKSIPPTSLSSQVMPSKSMKKERAHREILTVIICQRGASQNDNSIYGVYVTCRHGDQNSDEDTSADCNHCLPIVLIFEKAWIL